MSALPPGAEVPAASADDSLLWTLAVAAAAYFSGYATEGYEPHRL